MGLSNVCVVGHSMGGQVAMTLLLAQPQCANSLILCAPAGLEQFSVMEKTMYTSGLRLFDFISSDETSLRNTLESSFYRRQTNGDVMIAELTGLLKTNKPNYYKNMVESCINSMLDDTVLDKLHLIKHPALVIFGKNDGLIPNKLIHHMTTEKFATDAVKRLPGAILKLIPDAGHFVQWEKAEEVNESIKSFLSIRYSH